MNACFNNSTRSMSILGLKRIVIVNSIQLVTKVMVIKKVTFPQQLFLSIQNIYINLKKM